MKYYTCPCFSVTSVVQVESTETINEITIQEEEEENFDLKRSKSTQEVEINAEKSITNEPFAQQDNLVAQDDATPDSAKNDNEKELGEIISAFPVR